MRTRWAGSRRAYAEHAKACGMHPPRKKKHKKNKKHKSQNYVRPIPPVKKEPVVDYQEYLKCEWWIALRKYMLKRTGYRCSLCKKRNVQLQVHHWTYLRLWCERDEDLAVLCDDCHGKIHQS